MRHLDLATIETSGFHLIEASAGTGKTWTITALYILLILEKKLEPEEILVVTYTTAATAELRDRVRVRISDTLNLFSSGRAPRDGFEEILLSGRVPDRETSIKLLQRSLYSFDEAAIYTIHSFCQRALTENAFESGSLFDTEMTTDQTAILNDICDDYWRMHVLTESEVFLKYLTTAGCSPGKLAEPFKGHYQNPALAIIPVTDFPDLAQTAALCAGLVPDLTRIWRCNREDILQQLAQAKLSLSYYKPAQISTAARGIDKWLAAGDCSAPCPDLKLFTPVAIRKGQKKESSVPDHPFFNLCQRLSEALQQIEQACIQNLIAHQTALRLWIRQELSTRKQQLNLRCYDDLLLDLHHALCSPGGSQLAGNLRQRYRAALIDEFQDTDPLQWQIFHSIGNHADYPLYLIGDPKQAIYSFRGADIFAYLAAGKAVEPRNKSTLDTNRRSVAPLVSAVNALFESVDDPFLCRDINFVPVSSGRDAGHHLLRNGQELEQPLKFWIYPRDEQSRAARKNAACTTIVRTVAEEIARLLDGSYEIIDKNGRRNLKPGDIAVLVKAHYQADLVQEALRKLDIPAVQHGSATIFESVEALDMLRILRAVHEPSRERLVREALLTGSMGITANQVAEYLKAGDDNVQWVEWLQRFRKLHDAALSGGIISMAELLLGECGLRGRNLARTGGERTLTNVLQCIELLHHAEQEQNSGTGALILWLERRIAAREEDEQALLRLESDEDAVQLSTIHASKGLEYPIVFLPFAWDAPATRSGQTIFHDVDGTLTLDLGSSDLDDHKALTKQERSAEAARLLYVAVTRAEFLCYVIWGSISDAHLSPLFNLLHSKTIADSKDFKSYPDQKILADVVRCNVNENILSAEIMPLQVHVPPYRPTIEDVHTPFCRTPAKAIPNDWRVTSFSSIVAGSDRPQPQDYDALSELASQTLKDGQPHYNDGRSIFDFPRGAAAGSCLHAIFERLDFAMLTEGHITHISRTCLRGGGYQEHLLPAVSGMVTDVTRVPLIEEDSGFNLTHLTKGTWQTELEFYLPILQLDPDCLSRLFNGMLRPEQHGQFVELLERLDFRQSRGMLHGFMDMVFVHKGRYYIIDWKSNHLGFNCQDYSPAGMVRSMADHAYILQYHLYTLALDRHLRQRLPCYDFNSHFGGAIYIFLRGVSATTPGFGVFCDRPSAEFIQRANQILLD